MLDRRENQERKEKMVTMQEVIDKHRARIEDLTVCRTLLKKGND